MVKRYQRRMGSAWYVRKAAEPRQYWYVSVTHGLLKLATSSGRVASPAGSGTGAGVIWNHSRF